MYIFICGQTCTGKNTMLEELKEASRKRQGLQQMEFVVRDTTRPMREGEQNGVEYNFITNEEFAEKQQKKAYNGASSYQTTYGTWWYGIPKCEDPNKIYCLIVTPNEIYNIVKKYKGPFLTLWLYCYADIQAKRIINRLEGSDIEAYKESIRRILSDSDDYDFFTARILHEKTEVLPRIHKSLIINTSMGSDSYYNKYGSITIDEICNIIERINTDNISK